MPTFSYRYLARLVLVRAFLIAYGCKRVEEEYARSLERGVAIGSVTALAALGLGLPVGAWAGGYCPPPPPPADDGKCNAGNGNGSDVVTFVGGGIATGGDPGNS